MQTKQRPRENQIWAGNDQSGNTHFRKIIYLNGSLMKTLDIIVDKRDTIQIVHVIRSSRKSFNSWREMMVDLRLATEDEFVEASRKELRMADCFGILFEWNWNS